PPAFCRRSPHARRFPRWHGKRSARAAHGGQGRSAMRLKDPALRKITGGVLGAMALCAASAANGGESRPPLPIFDVHVHYNEIDELSVSPSGALALFDRSGVRMALVSSTPDRQTVKLLRAAPGRIVAELRPYRKPGLEETWFRDASVPAYLRERLAEGVDYKGIGEF